MRVFVLFLVVSTNGFAGLAITYGRWPKREIPYAVARDFRNVGALSIAIRQWNSQAPVKFVPRRGHRDYVRIVTTSSSMSSADGGRRGGKQLVQLSSDVEVGHILHELGHAAGLMHEHQRFDRDRFLKIHWEFLESSRVEANLDPYGEYPPAQRRVFAKQMIQQNFGVLTTKEYSTYGTPYDFDSVMQYDSIPVREGDLISAKDPRRRLPSLGAKTRLSHFDVVMLEHMYGREASDVAFVGGLFQDGSAEAGVWLETPPGENFVLIVSGSLFGEGGTDFYRYHCERDTCSPAPNEAHPDVPAGRPLLHLKGNEEIIVRDASFRRGE